jgi:hypothetical protein
LYEYVIGSASARVRIKRSAVRLPLSFTVASSSSTSDLYV